MNIQYTINKATVEKLAQHLLECDDSFVPPLSGRVNISDYSQKLFLHAARQEAWDQDQLIGLVAMYMNGSDKEQAFITNVSVLPAYTGSGIATRLLELTEQAAREQGYRKLVLEVASANTAAIALYMRLNFVIDGQTESKMRLMSKYLI